MTRGVVAVKSKIWDGNVLDGGGYAQGIMRDDACRAWHGLALRDAALFPKPPDRSAPQTTRSLHIYTVFCTHTFRESVILPGKPEIELSFHHGRESLGMLTTDSSIH